MLRLKKDKLFVFAPIETKCLLRFKMIIIFIKVLDDYIYLF